MAKDFKVRLKCPYGDQDQWVILTNREEELKQILNVAWDFECPLHGVQREIPIEGTESVLPQEPRARTKEVAKTGGVKAAQRSSKRIALRLAVLVYGWTGNQTAFHEETSTFVVNASGGLIALATKVKLGDTVFLVNRETQAEQECRVAYVGPEIGSKLRVGVAFKRPSPDFWRIHRQPYRITKPLRVRVRGTDRNGNSFVQSAYTIDVSRTGARLDGLGYLTLPGATIEIRRRWRKARFQVVWVGEMGTPEANQIGVRCLEPDKNIWDVPALHD